MEMLIAMVIMGIAFVAILGGIGISATGSSAHRAKADADVVLKQYAEQIKALPYLSCTEPTVDYTLSGFDGGDFEVALNSVAMWQQNTTPATFAPFSPGPACVDTEVQLVTVEISDRMGRLPVQTMSFVKRKP